MTGLRLRLNAALFSPQCDVLKQGGSHVRRIARSRVGAYGGPDSSNEDSSDDAFGGNTCTRYKSTLATVRMQVRIILKKARRNLAMQPGSFTLTYTMGMDPSQIGTLSYWIRTDELGMSLSMLCEMRYGWAGGVLHSAGSRQTAGCQRRIVS